MDILGLGVPKLGLDYIVPGVHTGLEVLILPVSVLQMESIRNHHIPAIPVDRDQFGRRKELSDIRSVGNIGRRLLDQEPTRSKSPDMEIKESLAVLFPRPTLLQTATETPLVQRSDIEQGHRTIGRLERRLPCLPERPEDIPRLVPGQRFRPTAGPCDLLAEPVGTL